MEIYYIHLEHSIYSVRGTIWRLLWAAGMLVYIYTPPIFICYQSLRFMLLKGEQNVKENKKIAFFTVRKGGET